MATIHNMLSTVVAPGWTPDLRRQPSPGQPDGRYEAPNVVTAPGLAPTGNRHERRKAAALKRRRG